MTVDCWIHVRKQRKLIHEKVRENKSNDKKTKRNKWRSVYQHKKRRTKEKGGRIKQPPFIVYVHVIMAAQLDKP